MKYKQIATISFLCTSLWFLTIHAAQEPGKYTIYIGKEPNLSGFYYFFGYTSDKNGNKVIRDAAPLVNMTNQEPDIVTTASFPALQNTMRADSEHPSEYIYLFVSTKREALLNKSTNTDLSPNWKKLIASKRIPYKPGCVYDGTLTFTVSKKKGKGLSISMDDKRSCTNRFALLKKEIGDVTQRVKRSFSRKPASVPQAFESESTIGPDITPEPYETSEVPIGPASAR